MSSTANLGLRRKKRRSADINLASMMDMAFILLIFFIVTTSFTRETGVDVNKPQAATSQDIGKNNILVGVTKDGHIYVNESQVTLKVLGSVLKRYMTEDPNRAVIIVADRDAPVSSAVDVLDQCNLAGVKKASLASEKK